MILFTACPDHIHVSVSLNKSSLHEDTVRLTSTLSGVSLGEVEYYWWLIHEINSPLYTYSVKGRLFDNFSQSLFAPRDNDTLPSTKL